MIPDRYLDAHDDLADANPPPKYKLRDPKTGQYTKIKKPKK